VLKIFLRSFRILLTSAVAVALALPVGALAGSLSGRVSDSSGEKYLQSAEVELVELGRSTETGPNGAYRFADVPDGSYTLRVRYVGAESAEQKVTVSGDTSGPDLRLAATDTVLDDVLVVGQRASMSSSLSRQRAADGVESVLSRDSIGQFPDQNVAESLRRVTGVNVLDDQGEGRYVSVRGLDPDLNAASVNGARLPSPESDTRMVALDTIPSDMIESIEVKKSLTPDMDADTIGASLEIHTTSALDREKPYFGASVEGSYNHLNSEWSPKGSVDFSTRMGERFGIAGGLSYYKRKTSTDNIEMDDWTDDGALAFAQTVEYRDYDVERERIGSSLSLDFLATDNTTLFARLLQSKYGDQEYRGRLGIEMDGDPASGSGNVAVFDDADDRITVIRDVKDRYEVQHITSLVLGGKTFTGPWTFDYNGSFSKADEKEHGSLDPTRFRNRFDDDGLMVQFDYSRLTRPAYEILAGEADFLDPTVYDLNKVDRTTLSDSRDKESAFQVDLERVFSLSDGEFSVRFGGKLRDRRKLYNSTIDSFQWDGVADYTLADVLGSQSYGLAGIEPVPNGPAARAFFDANMSSFVLDDLGSLEDSTADDYRAKEKIAAGYLLGRLSQGPLRMVGGARVEKTGARFTGNVLEVVDAGATYNGQVLAEDSIFITPTAFSKNYTDVLPSLNVRYEAGPDVVLRSAVYGSVVRPKFSKAAPRYAIGQDDNNSREAEFGNPDLKPYRATNVDLSAEWYLASNGVLQGGLFYKRIKDFAVDVTCDALDVNGFDFCLNGVYRGVAFDEATVQVNGDKATVKGFELAYQQSLGFLPAPLDGLLIGFNYTYTDSKGRLSENVSYTIPLPASSKNNYNAMLGYEKGPLSLRLTAAYRDEYLDEFNGDPLADRWVKDHLQIDFSAKFRVTPHAQLFAELVNLTNEPYIAYRKGTDSIVQDRLLQYETYSWTAKAGVRITFK
jgi:TonB-dependent receptor